MTSPLSQLQSETQANSGPNETIWKAQSCSLQLGVPNKKGEDGYGWKSDNKPQKLNMESTEGTSGGDGNGVLKRNLTRRPVPALKSEGAVKYIPETEADVKRGEDNQKQALPASTNLLKVSMKQQTEL